MGDVFLIFQQPVDRWFVVHRFVDCFGGRLAIGFEQDLVIDFDFCHAGVEPDGNNDSQIIRFFLGDVPRSDRIQDSVGNPCLDRSHEDVGVFRVFDGHFADHQCDGSHLNITIQDGKHAGMSFGLVSQQIGDGISHGAIEFADDDFWFGGRVGRFGFDQAPRADITAYFRDYSSFPMGAAPRDTEGPCALFLIGDSGDPGRSRPVDGGDITITGGVEPIALTVDNRTFDYLSEPPADELSDLWNPGDLLEFRGPGSDRVGAVQRDLAAPDDVVVTAPVAGDFGALELARDAATVTWTAGNGDYVLLTLSNANADQIVECTVPDDGVIDLPPPALAWFDDGVDTISISLARVRERVFDTANPRARATIRAERLRILEQVDLL